MSKIVFFSIPAYGHTNPTIEVVRELVGRGHEVLYYSFGLFEDKITQAGGRFIACDGYLMELKKEDEKRVGKDFGFLVEMLTNATLSMDEKVCSELREFQPDCIVADSMCFWGKLFAAKLSIPYICSTTTFAFNRYSARIMKRSFSEFVGMLSGIPRINRYIRQLQEHGYPVKRLLDIIQNDSTVTTIVYTSFRFQPCAETFPEDKFFFVGPSVAHTDVPVPERKRKRIYISLGTVNNRRADFYGNCIRAFDGSDMEVIISAGEQTDLKALGSVPSNITVAASVKQIEVLQNVDVFLSHCGMNSVNESLYYGVPLVLFPQQSEQGGVAERVSRLGAGVFLKKNSPKAIKNAVLEVLTHPSYKEKAMELSADFRSCGGPKMAADVICRGI